MYVLPMSPSKSSFQQHSLERGRCCWDRLVVYIYDWTQLRPLYKLLGFWPQMQRSTCPAAAKDKPLMEVLLLVTPATCPSEWSPSSCGLSSPSMYEASLRFHPRSSQGCFTPRNCYSGASRNVWWSPRFLTLIHVLHKPRNYECDRLQCPWLH